MNIPEIEFIIVVANRDKEDAICQMLIKNEVKLINTVFGQGVSRREVFKKSLGLSTTHDKAIMLGIVRREISFKIINILEEEFKFNEINNGLSFTLPIEQIKF